MKYYVSCSKCGERIPIKGRYETVDEIREKEGEVFVRTCLHCGTKRHYAYCDITTKCHTGLMGVFVERAVYVVVLFVLIIVTISLICILSGQVKIWLSHNGPGILKGIMLFAGVPIVLYAVCLGHKASRLSQFEESAKLARFPRMTHELFDSLYDEELNYWCNKWCYKGLFCKGMPDDLNRVEETWYYFYFVDIPYDILWGMGWEKSPDGEYLFVKAYREIGAVKHAEALQTIMTEENERFCCTEWTQEKDSDPMHSRIWQLFMDFSSSDYGEDVDALLVGYLRKNADSICEA